MRSKRCGCGRDSEVAIIVLVGSSNVKPRERANSEVVRLCRPCLEQAKEAILALPGRSGGSRLLRATARASRSLLRAVDARRQAENSTDRAKAA